MALFLLVSDAGRTPLPVLTALLGGEEKEHVGEGRRVHGQASLVRLPAKLAGLFLAPDRKSELCKLVHFQGAVFSFWFFRLVFPFASYLGRSL